MAVRVGLILSALAVVVGILYATGGNDDRYPDLAWLRDYIALMGVAAALVVIWLGVGVASLIARRQRGKLS